MRFGKLGMAAVAAASLVSAPVMAQAVDSSQPARASAQTADESDLEGGSGIILAILAAAAIIAGIIIAADGSEDTPTSP